MNADLHASLGRAVARAQAVEQEWHASPNPAVSKRGPKHDLAGYGHTIVAMRFMRWAIEQEQFPTIPAVMTHFSVCRATAYRWTMAYAEACGIDPHNRHGRQPL